MLGSTVHTEELELPEVSITACRIITHRKSAGRADDFHFGLATVAARRLRLHCTLAAPYNTRFSKRKLVTAK